MEITYGDALAIVLASGALFAFIVLAIPSLIHIVGNIIKKKGDNNESKE